MPGDRRFPSRGHFLRSGYALAPEMATLRFGLDVVILDFFCSLEFCEKFGGNRVYNSKSTKGEFERFDTYRIENYEYNMENFLFLIGARFPSLFETLDRLIPMWRSTKFKALYPDIKDMLFTVSGTPKFESDEDCRIAILELDVRLKKIGIDLSMYKISDVRVILRNILPYAKIGDIKGAKNRLLLLQKQQANRYEKYR